MPAAQVGRYISVDSPKQTAIFERIREYWYRVSYWMLQLCALLEKVTVQMLSWSSRCCHRRTGNQLVMPDRKIDARDGVKRRESYHAYFLNL